MDGSLVSPISIDNQLIWATRKHRMPDIELFVHRHPNYSKFCRNWIQQQVTPLFEWISCSTNNVTRIPKTSELVFLCLRHNETGEYISLTPGFYENLNEQSIQYAPQCAFDTYDQLEKDVQQSKYREGVVIKTVNSRGHQSMFKLKTNWFLDIAYAMKEGGKHHFLPNILKKRHSLKAVPLDRIWITVIQNTDDVISQCVSHIEDLDEKTKFMEFTTQVSKSIIGLEKELKIWISNCRKKYNDSAYLIHIAKKNGWPEDLIRDLIQSKSTIHHFKLLLVHLVKRKKYDALYGLLGGIIWNEQNADFLIQTHNQKIHIPDFKACSKEICNHVVDKYLPKKLSMMSGNLEIIDGVKTIFIPRNYNPYEGKLKGYWEQFINENIWDLRIDLQPSCKTQCTHHNGNDDYALLLVQYGLKGNLKTKPFGSFGGVFIPTEYHVPVS